MPDLEKLIELDRQIKEAVNANKQAFEAIAVSTQEAQERMVLFSLALGNVTTEQLPDGTFQHAIKPVRSKSNG